MSRKSKPHFPAPPAASPPAQPAEVLRDPAEGDYLIRALSHDMNASMMVLRHAWRRLLERLPPEVRPSLQEEIDGVQACLREPQRLLDDLLTLARTGSIDMRPEPVAAGEIVAEVLREQQELIQTRGAHVEVAPRLPRFLCHRKRLKQIVTNLVRNALLHGCDAREPRICIRPGEAGAPDDRLASLEIHDNGPGIPADQREKIFQLGCRLPGSRSEGSGIGLAIVEKICRYYGGVAFVDPCPGPGTTMVIRLPRASAGRHLRGPNFSRAGGVKGKTPIRPQS